MLDALLRRTARRFTFVVGKGGVGKTTAAAGLALALADDGAATHLLSTDPAHSLGDVFGQAADAPRAAACQPRLVLEELDAPALGRRWTERLGPGLAELVERGTYLDREDAERFLDLALPGVDEAAAVLRLAELAEADAARVVVDTAPTGHTLRLLDTPATLRGWLVAFEAMAEKAGAVAEALVRRRVTPPGAAEVGALERALARFEQDVLGAADFVVVTRSGALVEAETARLRSELERRGLSVVATVAPAGHAPAGVDVTLPWIAGTGCDALRRLRRPAEHEQQPPRATPPAARDAGAPGGAVGRRPSAVGPGRPLDRPTLERLFGRELLLIAGKGGVGKSTVAAALALRLAERQDVALLGVDPAGSLADVLDAELPAEGLRRGRLLVRQLDAASAFEEFRERYRERVDAAFEALGLARAAALDRAVVESLWRLAPPGADELFALAALVEAESAHDTLVVDAAPTGHFLRLVEMPRLALDWLHALMRVMLKLGGAGLDDVAASLLEAAKRLKALRALLTDAARCGAVVVTLDEAVVDAETSRLLDALERAGIATAAVIRNRDGAARGRVTIVAPELAEPPVGERALAEFLERWRVL